MKTLIFSTFTLLAIVTSVTWAEPRFPGLQVTATTHEILSGQIEGVPFDLTTQPLPEQQKNILESHLKENGYTRIISLMQSTDSLNVVAIVERPKSESHPQPVKEILIYDCPNRQCNLRSPSRFPVQRILKDSSGSKIDLHRGSLQVRPLTPQ